MAAAFRREAVGVEIPTSSRINSRISEIDPPATAVAWLAPDSDIYMLFPLECVPDAQLNPSGIADSSALPEQIFTPGATKSGLTLPSIEGPCAEKFATTPSGLVVDAPTDITFFAVDGAITFDGSWLASSPAEKIGKNVGLSLTNTSTDLESAV